MMVENYVFIKKSMHSFPVFSIFSALNKVEEIEDFAARKENVLGTNRFTGDVNVN
jgi:hypothetical protein